MWWWFVFHYFLNFISSGFSLQHDYVTRTNTYSGRVINSWLLKLFVSLTDIFSSSVCKWPHRAAEKKHLEFPTWIPGWSSETYLRAAHCVSNKSLAAPEKPHAVIGSGAAITSETPRALRQHGEVAGSLTGGGIVKHDCWRLVSEWARDCNFISGGYFTSCRNPRGCEYYFREESVHRSNRLGSHKHVSPQWIILPLSTHNWTVCIWRHLSLDTTLFFHVVWGSTTRRQRASQTTGRRTHVVFHLIFFSVLEMSAGLHTNPRVVKNLPIRHSQCVLQQHPLLPTKQESDFMVVCLVEAALSTWLRLGEVLVKYWLTNLFLTHQESRWPNPNPPHRPLYYLCYL